MNEDPAGFDLRVVTKSESQLGSQTCLNLAQYAKKNKNSNRIEQGRKAGSLVTSSVFKDLRHIDLVFFEVKEVNINLYQTAIRAEQSGGGDINTDL